MQPRTDQLRTISRRKATNRNEPFVPYQQRRIQAEQLLRDKAVEVFQIWTRKSDKIFYWTCSLPKSNKTRTRLYRTPREQSLQIAARRHIPNDSRLQVFSKIRRRKGRCGYGHAVRRRTENITGQSTNRLADSGRCR